MKILTDFHTHTIYSKNNHGKGTIEENVQAAIAKGLKELWITDHGSGHFLFGLSRKKISEVRKKIDDMNIKYEGQIKVYFGVESNVLTYNGRIDVLPEELSYFDGINCGFHYGVIPRDLKSILYFNIINPLSKLIKPLRNWIAEKNTDALINVVNKNDIQILTHPGDKVGVNIKRLADACVKRGTALEINSSHRNLTTDQIKEAMPTGVMFSVGSDAHKPENIANFRKAIRRIEKAKLPGDRLINKMEEEWKL